MWRQFRPFEPDEFIVVGADTAGGGPDYCAAQFISKTRLDVPLVYHAKGLATEMTGALFPVLERIEEVTGIPPVVAYERNNGGLFEMERLAALNRSGRFIVFQMPTYGNTSNPDSPRLGWDTNSATRPKMLSDLKEAMDKRLLQVSDRPTIEEMFAFIVVESTSAWRAQAEKGAHDDLVMALAVAWQLYQLAKQPAPTHQAPPDWFTERNQASARAPRYRKI